MRLVITGGAGMLGTDLARLARGRGHEVVAPGHRELDVTVEDRVRAVLAETGAEGVVNAAAFTDVDGSETREAEAHAVNGAGAGICARAARHAGARFVHVSSDYVFPGDAPRPRTEGDPTGPRSAYGRSKLAGETEVEAAGGCYTIIRSAWLYGAHGRNFVDTIRKKARETGGPLRVVEDQTGSPTWTVSLASAILDVLALPEPALMLHFANRGAVSWYDFAKAIVEREAPGVEVNPMKSTELGRPAPRPTYSVLDTTRFERLCGRRPLGWREALSLYLDGATEETSVRPVQVPARAREAAGAADRSTTHEEGAEKPGVRPLETPR